MFYILISSANSDVQEFSIISFVLTTKFQLEQKVPEVIKQSQPSPVTPTPFSRVHLQSEKLFSTKVGGRVVKSGSQCYLSTHVPTRFSLQRGQGWRMSSGGRIVRMKKVRKKLIHISKMLSHLLQLESHVIDLLQCLF